MKAYRHLLTGCFLGIMVAAGFWMTTAPFWQRHASFLLGFAACLLLVLILFAGWVWFRVGIVDAPTKMASTEIPDRVNAFSRFIVSKKILYVLMILTGVWICYGLYGWDQWLKKQEQQHRENQIHQMELLSAIQRSSRVPMMEHVMRSIEADLAQLPGRTLRAETIARIAALSDGLKPYRYTAGDSISVKRLSPERGQLLLQLVGMNLDTATMDSILAQVTFAYADLQGAFLNGAYLQGADLHKANLREAQLAGARLRQADLSFSNLWSAHLARADLQGAKVRRSDLRWSNMNEADLSGADLTEVNLVSARLRKTNLRKAILEWSDLTGALLEDADLTGTNLYTTLFIRAQCTGTRFEEANLTSSTLIEANLTGANLTRAKMDYAKLNQAVLNDAIVGERNWLDQLSDWNVTGASWVKEHYTITESPDGLRIIDRYQGEN